EPGGGGLGGLQLGDLDGLFVGAGGATTLEEAELAQRRAALDADTGDGAPLEVPGPQGLLGGGLLLRRPGRICWRALQLADFLQEGARLLFALVRQPALGEELARGGALRAEGLLTLSHLLEPAHEGERIGHAIWENGVRGGRGRQGGNLG